MMFGEIKLSPLILFIIILLVLVIATTIKNYGLVSEGFGSYKYEADMLSDQKVTQYDDQRNIKKLYDELFYDPRNGNVVAVYSPTYSGNSNATVSKIEIAPRDIRDNIMTYENVDAAARLDESKKNSISSIDTHWTRKFQDNQLVYMTMGTDTFLYVIDLAKTGISGNTASYAPVLSMYYNGNQHITNDTYSGITINLESSYSYVNDGNDKKMVMPNPFYHPTRKLYQVTSNVNYDISNGNILVRTATGTSKKFDVYYRKSADYGMRTRDVELTSNTPDANGSAAAIREFKEIGTQPYFIPDTLGKNTIMYWPKEEYTVIALFGNALDSYGAVQLRSCVRFNKSGVYTTTANNTDVHTETVTPPPTVDISGNADLFNQFSKWYIYFNSAATANTSDYLLKTQVVPPVCPACPSCQSGGGVCTNCGGNGGSGTQTSSNGSMAFDNSTVVGSAGNLVNNTIGTAGNIVNSTIDSAGNVVGKTVDVAGNVVGKTVDVAGNVVGKTADVATNVVGKTLDTATNIVGKTFDAAGNLLGSTADRLGLDRVGYQQSYRGPMNTSSSANATGYPSSAANNTTYRPGSNTTGVSTLPNASPNDMYSYNGKLQPKGSNYVALTSDFSRFGR
jgi:hypothetical protein